jgi:adenosine deaminase
MLAPEIPLVDLHRHLEGSIRLQTVLDLSRKHNLSLPAWDLPGLKRHIYVSQPFADILDILPRFSLLTQVIVDYEACSRITLECIEDAAQEGLDYVELRFSPLFMAEPHGLDPLSVTAVVCEAWQEAQRLYPVKSNLIVILSRTYGAEACEIELEAAQAYRNCGIIGLDLAGDEARHPAGQFAGHFQRAREAGLRLTAHAGEFAGAESVRQTVLALAPERLGHAVHAADDPAVLDLLAEKQIAVECCPTSNYYTTAVRRLAAHPLPRFLASGICATLNTDDPSLFHSIDVAHEYRLARDEMGVSPAGLRRLQENGLQAAFLSAAERARLLQAKSR